MPGSDKHTLRVGLIAHAAVLLKVLAVHGLDVGSFNVEVLGPVGTPAELLHEVLEALVVAVQVRRVLEVRAVDNGVKIQRGAVGTGRVEVGADIGGDGSVANADFNGGVDVEAVGREGDVVRHVIRVLGGKVVDPGAEPAQDLGALLKRKSPLVDVLRVEAVEEQGLGAGLDGGKRGAVPEAVLHAEDEPLDPGQDGGDVVSDVEEVVVDGVAEEAVVVAGGRVGDGLGGAIGLPDDGAAGVREPPDTDELALGPKVARPPVKDLAVGVNCLPPSQLEGGHGAEGELGDDAEGAEGKQGCPEQLGVLIGGARTGGSIGEGDLEGDNVFREQAVAGAASMGAGADCAGDGLVVDAAEIGHGEAVAVELVAQLEQANAALHNNQSRLAVNGEDLVEAVEVDEPAGGAGQVGGRVAAAGDDNAAAAAAGEGEQLLDLRERLGLDEELGTGGEGSRPRAMDVVRAGAECDAIAAGLFDLGGDERVHHERGQWDTRRYDGRGASKGGRRLQPQSERKGIKRGKRTRERKVDGE